MSTAKFSALLIDLRILPSDATVQLIDLGREETQPSEFTLKKSFLFPLCKEQAGGVVQLLPTVIKVLLVAGTAKALRG